MQIKENKKNINYSQPGAHTRMIQEHADEE